MPNATVEYIGDDGVTRKMEFTEDIEPRAITNFFEKYLEPHIQKRPLESFDF